MAELKIFDLTGIARERAALRRISAGQATRKREQRTRLNEILRLSGPALRGDRGAQVNLAARGVRPFPKSDAELAADEAEKNRRAASEAARLDLAKTQEKRLETQHKERMAETKARSEENKRRFETQQTQRTEDVQRRGTERTEDVARRGVERTEDIRIRAKERKAMREASLDKALGIDTKRRRQREKAATGAAETVLPPWNDVLETRDLQKRRYLMSAETRIAYDRLQDLLGEEANRLLGTGVTGTELMRRIAVKAVQGLERIPGISKEDIFDLIPQARPTPKLTPEEKGQAAFRKTAEVKRLELASDVEATEAEFQAANPETRTILVAQARQFVKTGDADQKRLAQQWLKLHGNFEQ